MLISHFVDVEGRGWPKAKLRVILGDVLKHIVDLL